MNFRRIQISDRARVNELLGSNEGLGWEYSFAMLWAWDVFDATMICDDGDAIFVYTKFFGKTIFFPPILKDNSKFCGAIEKIREYCRDNGLEFAVHGVMAEQDILLDKTIYASSVDRNTFDYVYLASDLSNLVGKKFHAKRNYITRFESRYKFVFRDYAEEDYAKLMQLYDKWYVTKTQGIIDLERKAIDRSLKSYKELRLKIGVIDVTGKIAAFSISDVTDDIVAHTFFEKGDTSYEGVYQAINKYTAKKYFTQKYVNRQEDLGLEGLRKVKLSYHPNILLEKYRVVLAEKEDKSEKKP